MDDLYGILTTQAPRVAVEDLRQDLSALIASASVGQRLWFFISQLLAIHGIRATGMELCAILGDAA
jgi:hypothetical protein